MTGRRVYPDVKGILLLKEGEYGKDIDGLWFCRPPGCHMGALSKHQIVEHEDGTVTVSPSILLYDGGHNWHGFLQKGIWKTV